MYLNHTSKRGETSETEKQNKISPQNLESKCRVLLPCLWRVYKGQGRVHIRIKGWGGGPENFRLLKKRRWNRQRSPVHTSKKAVEVLRAHPRVLNLREHVEERWSPVMGTPFIEPLPKVVIYCPSNMNHFNQVVNGTPQIDPTEIRYRCLSTRFIISEGKPPTTINWKRSFQLITRSNPPSPSTSSWPLTNRSPLLYILDKKWRHWKSFKVLS